MEYYLRVAFTYCLKIFFGVRLLYSWHHISTTQPVCTNFSSIQTCFYLSFLCVSTHLEELQPSIYIKSIYAHQNLY